MAALPGLLHEVTRVDVREVSASAPVWFLVALRAVHPRLLALSVIAALVIASALASAVAHAVVAAALSEVSALALEELFGLVDELLEFVHELLCVLVHNV